ESERAVDEAQSGPADDDGERPREPMRLPEAERRDRREQQTEPEQRRRLPDLELTVAADGRADAVAEPGHRAKRAARRTFRPPRPARANRPAARPHHDLGRSR